MPQDILQFQLKYTLLHYSKKRNVCSLPEYQPEFFQLDNNLQQVDHYSSESHTMWKQLPFNSIIVKPITVFLGKQNKNKKKITLTDLPTHQQEKSCIQVTDIRG